MKDAVLKIIESKNKENIEVLENENGSYYSKIPFSKYRLAKQYFKKDRLMKKLSIPSLNKYISIFLILIFYLFSKCQTFMG